ncbi:DUF3300 domain-containing protein [Luteibacter yeojuensis]
MSKQRFSAMTLSATLCIGTLAACSQQQPDSAPAAPSTAPAPAATIAQQPQAPAYTPPTADQLYQLVAPIALFPDKLVAQVLAGSTYPDQIAAADHLVAQNPKLKGALLQTAVEPQPWDASVKGLTAFPSVLDQMARNADWTTALGQAYVNDPTDVLNAIQVMRERATQRGSLRTSPQQRVTTQSVTTTEVQQDGDQPTVIAPPRQVIEIEPAQEDTVYVPSYDPGVVYGEEAVYPRYTYVRSSYSTGNMVAVGAVSFGVGVLVGALLDHHDGGWHAWGMNWHGGYEGGGYNGGGWHRPAVIYNNQTYVSHSTTVVNRYTTNNINNGTIVNNRDSFNRATATVNNIHDGRNVTNNVDNRRFDSHDSVRPAQMSVPDFAHAGYRSAAPPPVPYPGRPERAGAAERPESAGMTARPDAGARFGDRAVAERRPQPEAPSAPPRAFEPRPQEMPRARPANEPPQRAGETQRAEEMQHAVREQAPQARPEIPPHPVAQPREVQSPHEAESRRPPFEEHPPREERPRPEEHDMPREVRPAPQAHPQVHHPEAPSPHRPEPKKDEKNDR